MRKPSDAFSSEASVFAAPDAARVASAFHGGWIGDPGATLRAEDRLECEELAGFLGEVAHSLRALGRRRPLSIIDAAAGRGLVGVLAAHLLFPGGGVRLRLVERDPHSLARASEAGARLGVSSVEALESDLAAPEAFFPEPDLVTALHACGDASDRTIAQVVTQRARRLLLAPCCVARSLPASERAFRAAERSGLPRAGELLRRYVEAWVMAERVHELERHGYETEVVSFTSARVTPHHLVLRARRVNEPHRMARAAAQLEVMRALGA